MIELKGLTKQFHQKGGSVVTAVDNVSMTVETGACCVFLGPSGCGKSTTLKMINRLIEPSAGQILIDGRDAFAMDKVTLRRSLGYVIQQIGLFPNMTIEENITIVPRLLGWDKQRMRERARELMAMVALEPSRYLSRYPHEMSGGQQQRIGVIRALAADPPLMLMDEPFGAIDPINRSSIQDEFRMMQRELNKTVIMVSHDIDEALKLADKIAMFRSGRLVQFDKPDDLLARPADEFVASFIGADSTLKRLLLISAGEAAVRPVTVPVNMTAGEAVALMNEHDWRHLVMSGRDGTGLGYVRGHDLRKVDASRLCGEFKHDFAATATADENLRVLLSRMYEFNTSWLPVLDEAGIFIGEVTQESIAQRLSGQHD